MERYEWGYLITSKADDISEFVHETSTAQIIIRYIFDKPAGCGFRIVDQETGPFHERGDRRFEVFSDNIFGDVTEARAWLGRWFRKVKISVRD